MLIQLISNSQGKSGAGSDTLEETFSEGDL